MAWRSHRQPWQLTSWPRPAASAISQGRRSAARPQAEKVAETLAEHRIGVLSGSHGGSRLLDALGVNDEGGAVTIGLAPYTTRYDIDSFGRALDAI